MEKIIETLLRRFENETLSKEDYETTVRDIMWNVHRLVKVVRIEETLTN